MTDEPTKLFRVIDDEEAAKAGLLTELTEADKQRPPENLPAPATVVDQGIRSAPPIIHESKPPEDPPPVPWELLPERTRLEAEAGRRLIGGGLSAKEAYERSHNAKPPVIPTIYDRSAVTPPPEPAPEMSPRTLAEMEEGRRVLAEKHAFQRTMLARQQAQVAERFKNDPKPTGDEMTYSPEQPPG